MQGSKPHFNVTNSSNVIQAWLILDFLGNHTQYLAHMLHETVLSNLLGVAWPPELSV